MWPSKTPYWQKGDGKKAIAAIVNNRYSSTPPSRKDILAIPGVALASAEDNQKFLQHIRDLRADVMDPCCGKDEECRKAMESVEPYICSESAVNQDPTKEDPCYNRPGSYGGGSNSDFQKYWNMMMFAKDQVKFFRPQDIASFKKWADEAKSSIQPELYGKPIVGNIIVSPYTDGGERTIGDSSLRHEYGHACSDIQRQLQMYRSNSISAFNSLLRVYRDPGDPWACALDPTYNQVFQDILDNVPNGYAVMNCVFGIAWQVNNLKSQGFQDGGCPASKLEEGTAMVFEQLTSISTYSDPDGLCWGVPSHIHPHNSHIFECLLQNSEDFRQKAKKALSCDKVAK